MTQTIHVEPITRIEGHARVALELDEQGEVAQGRLHVLEIRGFEKLLRGMELVKMPLITARICGVCPAAHHLAAVIAVENGAGVRIPEGARLLRELLYLGHILHSHALSTFVLIGPDLLNGIDAPPAQRNIFHLLAANPELAKKALRLRSIGQRIVEIVGGRGIHPITAIPGGMAGAPTAEELQTMAGWGAEALGLLGELQPAIIAILRRSEALRAAAVLDCPALALSNAGVHDFLAGTCRVVDPAGQTVADFAAEAYGERMIEHVMPGSYMKTVRLRGSPEQRYFVGPLARLLTSQRFSTPQATAQADELRARIGATVSALDNIEARLIEMVHCAERISQIAAGFDGSGPLSVPVTVRAGRYVGMVEAPRGILIHDYTADEAGRVSAANLLVATQNNYEAINHVITALARHFKPSGSDGLLLNGIEFAIRCFDPCLSCATHAAGAMAMKVEMHQAGRLVATLVRQ